MRDKDLYARILNIEAPWRVDVELNLQQGEVVVHVEHDGKALNCPECGQPARRYDTRQRRWRHLYLRTAWRRAAAGVRPDAAPWSRLAFELVIDWLRGEHGGGGAAMGLSWEVDGIMQRAVQRGLERREVQAPSASAWTRRRFRNAMST